MKIIHTILELQNILSAYYGIKPIGFVPTMGALHSGHISLVDYSLQQNDITVASIYVNPTQFNDKSDLEKYPRDLEKDAEKLQQAGCDFLFAPNDKEMYPEPDNRTFNFGSLETVMEGKYRPGHFNGVGQIVSKLFSIVNPDKAYFGLKDFQQLAVIRKLVSIENFDIDIVPCPILRERDGLAMSSRNMLLEPAKRKAAPIIYQTLIKVREQAAQKTVAQLKRLVSDVFSASAELELEYFEIVNDENLQPTTKIVSKVPSTACIAVFAGKVRLIDNIQLNL